MFIILLLIAFIVITFIVESKRGGKYFEKLTPTMRFINAAGSSGYSQADCGSMDIGGNPENNWAKRHMRKLLKSGWNINSTEDLKSSISWLFNEGHNNECMELVKRYKEDPNAIEFIKCKKELKDMLNTLSTKYENKGILAWDICRICNIAGWGFLAKYITYEEAIEVSVDACKILQKNYNSWDDMMESYFCGLYYWSNDIYQLNNRKSIYESSKKNEDSIYNIPWDTVLDPKDVIPPRKK